MCSQSTSRTAGVSGEDGSIRLSPQAAAELFAVMRQMDLLLRSRHTDAALQYLLGMLRHLHALGREIV